MTNYFGKRRIKNIFYSYLSDRTQLLKEIQNNSRGLKYAYYKQYRGSEFFEFEYGDYKFKIYAFGDLSKVLTLDEYHYEENSGKYKSFNRVVYYYDEAFKFLSEYIKCPSIENFTKTLILPFCEKCKKGHLTIF